MKWWCKPAEAGSKGAEWAIGLCYYYGRGVNRDVAQAMVWFRKAAAQGFSTAADAVQSGVPGVRAVWEVFSLFTIIGSTAPERYGAARGFAWLVNESIRNRQLESCNRLLHEAARGASGERGRRRWR